MKTFKQVFEETEDYDITDALDYLAKSFLPEYQNCYGYVDITSDGDIADVQSFTAPIPLTQIPDIELITLGAYKFVGDKAKLHTNNYMQIFITDEKIFNAIENDPNEFAQHSEYWHKICNLLGLPN